ncbi:hypothetical protein MNBD_GAMMA18-2288 [hydrothermal vent metagenome]|uniref:Uncharacterized protein n=1 Tax=hydrothermal vent metagenome TaxID=652676 RepID=A0A3B1AAW6_9ZZZZ
MEFRELVKDCSKNNKNQIIHNADIDHAKDLFSELLSCAIEHRKPVRLVSGSLNDDFYGSLANAAEKIIAAGLAFEIIVTDSNVDLGNNRLSNVVKKTNKGLVLQAKKTLSDCAHFIVVGKSRWRFETNHEQTKAKANFNDPEIGSMIVHRFDSLKSKLRADK